jgi:creatinine amidohydrolase
MHFADMTWQQIERYLERDDRLILPIGACEQHCGLSLMTDIKVPLAIAERAARAESILIAPPLNFGVSHVFASYPGTISISLETLCDVLREVIGNLYDQGFKRILVLNGHGGNTPGLQCLQELAERHHDLYLQAVDWWRMPVAVEFADRIGAKQSHANWSENFSFTNIEQPDGTKPFVDIPRYVPSSHYRGELGDGSFGGDYSQPASVMNEFLEVVSNEITRLVRDGWQI